MRSKSTPRINVIWLFAAMVFLSILALFFYLWGNNSPREIPENQVMAQHAAASPATQSDQDIVYYSKKNDSMKIALTFDDGPHPYYTPIILDILKEYGIKATFFMIGENIKYYTEAAEAVLSAGHEIGNHTSHHKTLKPLCEKDILKEIQDCEDEIFSLAEYRTSLIRPPKGSMGQEVKDVVGELGYRIILWDVDTRDWAHTPPAQISAQVVNETASGDIILMHDFIGHNSPTPAALRMFIPELLAKGYQFVTVSELLEE